MKCKQMIKNRCPRIINHATPQMSHTLATCSGLWCSTPPWSLKPHGAPPESVMVISSTTMLLFCLLDSGSSSRGRGHSLHLYMVPYGEEHSPYSYRNIPETTFCFPTWVTQSHTRALCSFSGALWWGGAVKSGEGGRSLPPMSAYMVEFSTAWREGLHLSCHSSQTDVRDAARG